MRIFMTIFILMWGSILVFSSDFKSQVKSLSLIQDMRSTQLKQSDLLKHKKTQFEAKLTSDIANLHQNTHAKLMKQKIIQPTLVSNDAPEKQTLFKKEKSLKQNDISKAFQQQSNKDKRKSLRQVNTDNLQYYTQNNIPFKIAKLENDNKISITPNREKNQLDFVGISNYKQPSKQLQKMNNSDAIIDENVFCRIWNFMFKFFNYNQQIKDPNTSTQEISQLTFNTQINTTSKIHYSQSLINPQQQLKFISQKVVTLKKKKKIYFIVSTIIFGIISLIIIKIIKTKQTSSKQNQKNGVLLPYEAVETEQNDI